MVQLSRETRSFVLATVAASTISWRVFFNLGAYQTVFYEDFFTAWAVVTAVALAALLLPRRELPLSRWSPLVMIMPTVGFVVLFLNANLFQQEAADLLAIALSGIVYLICFPYALFVAIRIINPDLMLLPGTGVKLWVVAIAFFIGSIGFLLGSQNYKILTCGDFEISGSAPPANCQPGPPLQF